MGEIVAEGGDPAPDKPVQTVPIVELRVKLLLPPNGKKNRAAEFSVALAPDDDVTMSAFAEFVGMRSKNAVLGLLDYLREHGDDPKEKA